jgi:hypothetical protein
MRMCMPAACLLKLVLMPVIASWVNARLMAQILTVQTGLAAITIAIGFVS